MSLLDLKSLVSTEDFADAHEPLNDGVKDVPNAQTVAASVGTGDVGNDTTTQGPAKVIPEKPDTDDQTKTEHNVVKESAEKTGSTSTPASDKDSGDDANASAEPEKSEETDEAKEPLEHTSEKVAKDELEKTERATTALEAYAPNAKRFDIIGHPKVKAEQIGKMVGYIQRRAGVSGEVTVSAESINAAVELGRSRMAKLEREVRILGSQKVSKENLVEEIAVTEEPTEHGAPPLNPEAAAAITELETDPLDLPLLEIEKVQETIEELGQHAVAIEQYIKIVRANPNMSRQAAAVLHAGLEHIDQACSLKVRATGLESYVTTPRAAMEVADVNERTLLSRAGEIGAKILNWLIKLLEAIEVLTLKYSEGINAVITRFEALSKVSPTTTLPEATLKSVLANLFEGDEFVGDRLTSEEKQVPGAIKANRDMVTNKVLNPLIAILKHGAASSEMADEIDELLSQFDVDGERVIKMPGGAEIVVNGIDFSVRSPGDYDGSAYAERREITVPEMSGNELKRTATDILNYLHEISRLGPAMGMLQSGSKLKAAIIDLRGRSKGGDEVVFQKVQGKVMSVVNKAFHQRMYFYAMGKLAKAQAARATYFERRLASRSDTDGYYS